jgi:hypothetical protein
MGGGSWKTNVYKEREYQNAAAGKSAFDYTDQVSSLPEDQRKAHPTLDPMGVKVRESRDSEEHPESLAIGVIFDVTGSMLEVPVTLQKKLADLNELLVGKGYVKHPQILFGGVGDASPNRYEFQRRKTCDLVPLQIGQFESDNRRDENLGNIYLEGGGGGQKSESYELAMYFMARHTDIDCWNIRHHKGYLFLIGDEMAYNQVSRDEVKMLIGDVLPKDITTPAIVSELRKRYNVYYIMPAGTTYTGDREVTGYWRKLLGENFIELDDPKAVCETIAVAIGINEGSTDSEESDEHLKSLGVSKRIRQSVSKALALRGSLPAKGSSSLPGLLSRDTDEPRTVRL